MSQIISLVKYECHNEKLYEDNSETIETTFISEDCINVVNKSIAMAKIYEDYNSNEFSEIDCIGEIEKNIGLYEKEFIDLVKNNNNSIELFRTLTNVHHIFWLKKEKFNNYNNVIIKLG